MCDFFLCSGCHQLGGPCLNHADRRDCLQLSQGRSRYGDGHEVPGTGCSAAASCPHSMAGSMRTWVQGASAAVATCPATCSVAPTDAGSSGAVGQHDPHPHCPHPPGATQSCQHLLLQRHSALVPSSGLLEPISPGGL